MTDTLIPPTGLSVVVRERLITSRVSILDIEYDGSRPPCDLFADLRRLGWEGAVPSSPRAEVIDWSRPDPLRGTTYSVLPHQAVVSATLQAGVEECREIREQTQAVLARHGFGAADAVDADGADGADDVDDAPAPSAPTPVAGSRALVDVVCSLAAVAAVEHAVDGFGDVVEREGTTEVLKSVFRGNVSQTVIPVCRLRIEIDGDRQEEMVSVLSTVGVRRVVRVR